MSNYLSQWFDPETKVNPADQPAAMDRAEVERLNKLFAIATAAQAIPRRLGADATPEELSGDKKRCRRVAHVAQQLVPTWGGKLGGGSESIGREAAQVDWERWWGEHQVWLRNRVTYIASWAMSQEGKNEKWAKSAIVRLNNEYKWIEYALR